ncbi:HdeD family acid-resistance protein [Actinomadura flavalba]|uniref:HdeD family acid-resistance protein n=1 Tax=Actinomadura flavalba TaxID=1120938 RepID=UPI00037DD6A7|nr:HdeD family acid-resistance protein [Actinomadura flavalba]
MLDMMTRNWWVLALRGAFAVLFGVLALFWPGITVLALVLLFGAYALVDGAFSLYAAIRGGSGQSRGWLAVSGIAGVLLGIAALAWPAITGFALLMLIAAWAIVTGVMEIIAAVALRREIEGEWLYAVTGAVSVLFGVLLFVWPASGAVALIWMIGLFAILFGALLIGAAFRVRSAGHRMEARRGEYGPGEYGGGATASR